jgi:hypothetical protein
MAETNSRHTGNGSVAHHWAVPAPFEDELFSTWLARVALTLGCDPLTLTGELWPKWRPWTVDIDRGLDDKRMDLLVKRTGIKKETVEGLMLLSEAMTVSPTAVREQYAVWPWLLTLGARNRKRHGGLQYCPECLSEDKRPYFRKQWRLAWHTVCEAHNCTLLDRCESCNASLEPHRLDAIDRELAFCARCKSDLRSAKADEALPNALMFQQFADQCIHSQKALYGDCVLSPEEWFELSRYFVNLLRMAAYGNSNKLKGFIESLGVDITDNLESQTALALEMLPVHERATVFPGAWVMLEKGPDGFIAAALDSQISVETIHDKRFDFPRAINDVLAVLPHKGHSKQMQSESKAIPSPRSKKAVMRMMARLQRKLAGHAHE